MKFYSIVIRLILILVSIFYLFTTSLFIISHFSTYQQRHAISNYVNAIVSYGQKNGGFADVSKQDKIGSDQKQRATFTEWNKHLLTVIYNINVDLNITITTPYGETTARYEGKTRSISQDFNKSVLETRLNRGEEFTVSVKPTYNRFKFIPPKVYKTEGRPITQNGKTHGYIKVAE